MACLKQTAPGSAAVNKIQVWEQPIIGDLNTDGKEDAAVGLINSQVEVAFLLYSCSCKKCGIRTNTREQTRCFWEIELNFRK